jgi:thiamine-phosphate pyrophosphorylase
LAIASSRSQILRIIDANYNRTGEALRVVEEHARFALDSPTWAGALKDMRHRLLAAVNDLGVLADLAAHRDTVGDVGTRLTAEFERQRPGARDVVAANVKRACEGLRVLEEYAKMLKPAAASAFETLRYDLYSVEKGLAARLAPNERLAAARLYVLITTALCRGRDPEDVARLAIRGGADMIQLREKEMPDGEFLALARKLRELCCEAEALFIVNDRPHIARIVDADGVHLGQDDLPATEARRLLGAEKIIGVSTHSPDQAAAAIKAGASYIGVGPVNATPTKPSAAPVGLGYVGYASRNVEIPFFAIGGVAAATAGGILEAGARRLAVCSAVISADDPESAAAEIKQAVLNYDL